MRFLFLSALGAIFCLSAAHADDLQDLPDATILQSLADRILRAPSTPDLRSVPDRAICGTAARMLLRSRWKDLSEKTRARLTLALQQQGRPVSQADYSSPSGHFRLHFDTTGPHAVDPADSNRNNVPDYVEAAAVTADSAWSLEIDRFRFRPPPSDGSVGGGLGQFDIYIRELSRESVYGNTYPENTSATTTTSYIEIDNNFTDRVYASRGMAGLHVTLAHEFFHAVQFGYYSLFDAAWWQETTAVLMEDAAYTEVNDYYQYLPDYFKAPNVALDRFLFGFADLHPFGSAVFIHNLYALFGIGPIRAGWEGLAAQQAWDIRVIGDALPGGFDQVFPRFALWNYFTGTRNRSGYYPEGANYPLVKSRALAVKPGQVVADSARVDHLAADYVQILPARQSGGLALTLALSPGARWKTSVLLLRNGGVEIMETDGLQVRVPSWGDFDEIVVIPACVSLAGSNYPYKVSAEVRGDVLKPARAVGDFNADGSVGLPDFFAFVEGFGKTAATPGFDPRFDLNGDGAVGFDDFFIFAIHFGE